MPFVSSRRSLHLSWAGLAAAASLWTAAELPAAWPPDKTIPNMFGVQLKPHCDDPANLDQVKELGMKWVRRGFHWQGVEKEKGVYNFSHLDGFVADCKARGLTIVGVLALNNQLYGHVKDAPAREAYAKYAAALAAHYKGSDIVWEIWNEPNTMTFWGKHGKKGNSKEYAQEYYDLVKATVPAMKKADPNCVVVAGSVSNMWTESYKWMDFIFDMGVLKTGIDGWSVHPYGLKSPEDYLEAYDIMRKSIARVGGPGDLIVLNTERGFPLREAEGFAGGKADMAEEYQAWNVVRQYLIDMLCNVQATLWYEWIGEGKESKFSLFNPKRELPVFRATKSLIEQLRGFRLDQRIDVNAPRDFVLRFTNPSGAVKLVAWTSPPPHEPVDKFVPHEVQIPVGVDGPIPVADLYGKSETKNAVQGKLTLTLTGSPQYLTVKK